MTEKSKGLYRQPAGDDEPVAYVVSGKTAMFITESEYRADDLQPPFETLPSQEEYEAAVEKKDSDIGENESIAADRPDYSQV
jgi:hypothetical protein